MSDVRRPPRIGVYICQCGGNISDVIDVERVTEAASRLDGVVVARTNTFMCSDPGQRLVLDDIEQLGLERIVIAACSPKLHETTFRRVLERAGLNRYLYEHVNIREQVSWVTEDRDEATAKATVLVDAGVAKAALLQPLDPIHVETTPRVAIVGGGVAGLRAALDCARSGLDVTLLERGDTLGGNVTRLDRLFPTEEEAESVAGSLATAVLRERRITLFTKTQVAGATGYVGNFSLQAHQEAGGVEIGATGPEAAQRSAQGTYRAFSGFTPTECSAVQAIASDRDLNIEAGALIVATGFTHYEPGDGEYGFNRLPQVLTLPAFIEMLAAHNGDASPLVVGDRLVKAVAFIHCVGSRQVAGVNKPQPDGRINEYCSRVCCTATLHAICALQQQHPDVAVYDFYQDIRAYGRHHEEYYEQAAKAGAIFVRFAGDAPPKVRRAAAGDTGGAIVSCRDRLTWGEEVEAVVDLVVLAVGMVPDDAKSLIDSLKLPIGTDRFLLEVHPKLRPVELAVQGVFLAGASQGPRDAGEAVASASAAAVKAVGLLSDTHVELDPFVAHVDTERCVGSGVCVEECPYPGAIALVAGAEGTRHAEVNPALCNGCGACVAVCPARAIDVAGWTLNQYDAIVDAIVAATKGGPQ